MFKVSLLPASYRKLLEGKKKKDLILKIALIVLVCMLVIYSGFAIRLFILKSQLKEVQKTNGIVVAEINELEKYKEIYDSLVASQQKVDSIRAKSPSAVKFMSLVQATRPEYAEYSIVTVQEWSINPICMIEGELPAAQNIGDAVSQLRGLVEIFENGEDFKDVVTQIKVINDMPSVTRDVDGNETYTFRIYLSTGGNIVVDESGALVTTTTTTTTTTTAPAETTTTASTTTEKSGETTSEETTAE